ncbi:MAG: hypothetical protein HY758_06430 [Nitrospirae bacterium]|nr:hypothetical protein [Nitrospirota bacterium]
MARGLRQRIVATIGKLPSLDKEEHIGWEAIGRLLCGRNSTEETLFEKARSSCMRHSRCMQAKCRCV